MENLKDIYKGEVGVVVLNGPSLNEVPLEWLNSHRNISCNHIYLLDGFKVQTYVLVDTSCLQDDEHAAYFKNALNLSERNVVWEKHLNRAPPGSLGVTRGGNDAFHENIFTHGLGGYASTAWVCIQLAYHLGFTTVLLVGFDCSFVKDNYHFYKNEPNPFTHSPPVALHEWQSKLSNHMELARKAYEADGRKLLNCTPGSSCKVLEFADWKDY